jgi:UDPglucose 6-dehydrogenase
MIIVFGLGYVGLANVAFLSSFHEVVGCDIDSERIRMLKEGQSYLHEPHLQAQWIKHKKRISWQTDVKDMIHKARYFLVAVPTPSGREGLLNLASIEQIFEDLILLATKGSTIIIRSTILPVQYEQLRKKLNDRHRVDLNIVIMPEFVVQGRVYMDTVTPTRVVVGLEKISLKKQMQQLYPYTKKITHIYTTPQTAAFIKFASNSYLATKISFMNELSYLTRHQGLSIDEVSVAMGLDPRIGQTYLQAGLGFGGSCLPKDVLALFSYGKIEAIPLPIIESVLAVNRAQINAFIAMVLTHYHQEVSPLTFAVLGLAFKANTVDVSEAPSLNVITHLLEKGAKIVAYDPLAIAAFQQAFGDHPNLSYQADIQMALQGTDGAIILTSCPSIAELKQNDFLKRMRQPIVFDGAKVFSPSKMSALSYNRW